MLRIILILFLFLFYSTKASNANESDKKETIRIVGSASVYPVVSFISENINSNYEGKEKPFKNPIIESIGTGAGFDAFCKSEFSNNSPDIMNASREISSIELQNCIENNHKNIQKMTLGKDGITIAYKAGNSKLEQIDLSTKDLHLAFSKYIVKDGKVVQNKIRNWNQIDPKFPNVKITMYGPPSTSGTHDVFAEKMASYCLTLPEMKEEFKDKVKHACSQIRYNETYVAVADQDSTIARRVELQQNSVGILRFAYFTNSGKFDSIPLNGIKPNTETIVSGKYELSRPLFVYYNADNISKVAGMKEFLIHIAEYAYRNLKSNSFSKNSESDMYALPYTDNKEECLVNVKQFGINARRLCQ